MDSTAVAEGDLRREPRPYPIDAGHEDWTTWTPRRERKVSEVSRRAKTRDQSRHRGFWRACGGHGRSQLHEESRSGVRERGFHRRQHAPCFECRQWVRALVSGSLYWRAGADDDAWMRYEVGVCGGCDVGCGREWGAGGEAAPYNRIYMWRSMFRICRRRLRFGMTFWDMTRRMT